ncbi:MAG: type II toxin-antitoxin system Phd/YefM family antitoxin [Deltaproteobacteria bacterium]|nr:type II toxin-antitoxin system Phd/YefM family antitoxin [Deltaproteobacteria bacterium]
MMDIVNVHEAKTHFPKLLTRAHNGEEIIIGKAGKPYAKLIPLSPVKEREPGIAKGAVTDAFFEPLPESELGAFPSLNCRK